jgi:cytochrome c oxidase subunit 2
LRRVRRGSIFQLLGIAAIVAVVTSLIAVLIPWLPNPASEEAKRIDFVYWFTTVICIGVFAAVASVMVYSIVKFRARPDDDSDGAPIHGHTKLEIVWTAIPAILVTAISIVSAIVLAQNSRAGADPLIVKVNAVQFAWKFTYANGKSYGYLTLPKGRHVKLVITADDVIHSFWSPELSQKQDAVPGHATSLVITPSRTGTFPVICTELCGLGHSLMRSHVTILTADKFDAWMKAGGQEATGPPGLAVFEQYGCGGCHTLKSAPGANGTVGPDLDKLKQEAAQANQPLASFIRASIIRPHAYIAPGYPDAMPPNFGTVIPAPQLDELVQYLEQSAK